MAASDLMTRRKGIAAAIRQDAPEYVSRYQQEVHGEAYSRRPALASTTLRPSRLRAAPGRTAMDAAAMVEGGQALEELLLGAAAGDVITTAKKTSSSPVSLTADLIDCRDGASPLAEAAVHNAFQGKSYKPISAVDSSLLPARSRALLDRADAEKGRDGDDAQQLRLTYDDDDAAAGSSSAATTAGRNSSTAPPWHAQPAALKDAVVRRYLRDAKLTQDSTAFAAEEARAAVSRSGTRAQARESVAQSLLDRGIGTPGQVNGLQQQQQQQQQLAIVDADSAAPPQKRQATLTLGGLQLSTTKLVLPFERGAASNDINRSSSNSGGWPGIEKHQKLEFIVQKAAMVEALKNMSIDPKVKVPKRKAATAGGVDAGPADPLGLVAHWPLHAPGPLPGTGPDGVLSHGSSSLSQLTVLDSVQRLQSDQGSVEYYAKLAAATKHKRVARREEKIAMGREYEVPPSRDHRYLPPEPEEDSAADKRRLDFIAQCTGGATMTPSAALSLKLVEKAPSKLATAQR